ncbi:hypothetical protein M5G13_03380, partial [Pseudomonas sp. TNT2022 ID609]|uniref:hypothetical protein n=1 Tax=Pseudomonas rubra TaxID=2942627 RepID=UPI00235EE935
SGFYRRLQGFCERFALDRWQAQLPRSGVHRPTVGAGLPAMRRAGGAQSQERKKPYDIHLAGFTHLKACTVEPLHILRLRDDGEVWGLR